MTSEPILTAQQLTRVRMRALGLDLKCAADVAGQLPGGASACGADRAAAVVRHLFALQGQDWRASRWAVGVRADGLTVADVHQAVHSGKIVRSWPMRGTVHLVAAEDIGWMQRLTNPRVLAGAPKRRATLGMSDGVLERVTDATVAALSGGNSLDRVELGSLWTEAGIEWQPNWRYHLIWWLCQTGVTTFGPLSGSGPDSFTARDSNSGPRLVLASEWIPEPRDLTGDDALAEFALRYVRGRGAVSHRDLASWAQLPAAAAKRGLELAEEAGSIVRARRDGVAGIAGALWADPRALDAAGSTAAQAATGGLAHVEAPDQWLLLPAFDEHILGYADRSPQFDAAHLDALVPGRNGVFQATIVHGGRAVGTWRRETKSGAVTLTAFPGERIDEEAVAPQLARWAEFCGDRLPPGSVA